MTTPHVINTLSALLAREAGGLNPLHLMVLAIVCEKPSFEMADLATACDVSQVRAWRAADRLADLKLIRRMPDPVSDRKLRLVPTNAGIALNKRVKRMIEAAG